MQNRLMKLRKGKHLTIKQLSESLKINRHIITTSKLAQYEHNEKDFKLDDLVALSDLFQVPAVYLTGQSNIRNKEVFFDSESERYYFSQKNGIHQGQSLIDRSEIANISRERQINQYKIFKELFIIQGRNNLDEDSKNLEKALNSVAQNNLINIDDMFSRLNTVFEIFLKAYMGNKKEKNYDKKITNFIDDYTGFNQK